MNQDTDLFVQAFWVKCREVIRPEIDAAVGELRHAGNEANVATQEYSSVADRLPGHVGPSITLSLRRPGEADSADHPAIEFHGDVARQTVEVRTSTGRVQRYELAALETNAVKNEIDDWLGRLITRT